MHNSNKKAASQQYNCGIGSIACLVSLVLLFSFGTAQAQDNVGDDSTVIYPASYFTQYQPVTALDMLNRIPGMNIQPIAKMLVCF